VGCFEKPKAGRESKYPTSFLFFLVIPRGYPPGMPEKNERKERKKICQCFT
jgi:hypothetical protein